MIHLSKLYLPLSLHCALGWNWNWNWASASASIMILLLSSCSRGSDAFTTTATLGGGGVAGTSAFVGVSSLATTVSFSKQDDTSENRDSFDYHDDSSSSNEQRSASSQDNIKEYFATCIPGLSHILAQELIQIGAQNVEISGTSGVKFASKSTSTPASTSEEDIGMKAVMYVRTAHRIMELMASSSSSSPSVNNSHNDHYNYDHDYDDPYDSNADEYRRITNRESLYDFVQTSLPPHTLQRLLGNGKNGLLTLNVQIIMNNRKQIPNDLNHSHYNCLTVKNAIVDMVRDLRKDGLRPDVDLDDPDVPLMVVMRGVINDDDDNNKYKYKYNRRGHKKNQGRMNGGGRHEYYPNHNEIHSEEENEYYDYGSDPRNRYEDGNNSDNSSVHVSLYRILHSGGSSLHRRGYRSSSNAIHKAAMKETLASGLLLQSGFDKLCHAARYGDKLPAVLVDPMCGSGTFCIEAAMIAADYAPGLMRMSCFDKSNANDGGSGIDRDGKWNPHYIPPVVRWKDSNRDYWKKLVLEARDRASSGMEWMKASNTEYPQLSNCVIMANELNPGAYDLANANIINSGFSHMISLNEGDCIDWDLHGNVIPGRTIVVANPPWGLRLTEDIEGSWMSLKSFLREECNEAEAWILSGSKSATRYLRMKKTRSVVIKTAGEDLRWIQYHIFKKKAPV